jgi:hypothetical protein
MLVYRRLELARVPTCSYCARWPQEGQVLMRLTCEDACCCCCFLAAAAATAAAVARLFSTARTSLKLLHHVMAVDATCYESTISPSLFLRPPASLACHHVPAGGPRLLFLQEEGGGKQGSRDDSRERGREIGGRGRWKASCCPAALLSS